MVEKGGEGEKWWRSSSYPRETTALVGRVGKREGGETGGLAGYQHGCFLMRTKGHAWSRHATACARIAAAAR